MSGSPKQTATQREHRARSSAPLTWLERAAHPLFEGHHLLMVVQLCLRQGSLLLLELLLHTLRQAEQSLGRQLTHLRKTRSLLL